MDAESAYRDFAAHVGRCATCAAAGGEWATDDELCQRGRRLARAWHREELAELRRRGDLIGRERSERPTVARRAQSLQIGGFGG